MLDSTKSVADIIKEASSHLDTINDVAYLMIAGTKSKDDSILNAILKINAKNSCLIPMLSNIIIAMAKDKPDNSINDILVTLAQDIDLRLENPDE